MFVFGRCKPACLWGFHWLIFSTQLEGHTAISLDLKASESVSNLKASEDQKSKFVQITSQSSQESHQKSWSDLLPKNPRSQAFSLLPMSSNISTVKGHLRALTAVRKLWCLQCSHPLSHRVRLLRHCCPTCQACIFGVWIWQDAGSSVTTRMTWPFFTRESITWRDRSKVCPRFFLGKDGKTDFSSPNFPQMKRIMFSPTSIFFSLEIATEFGVFL